MGIVALAELGDKTMLATLAMAMRFGVIRAIIMSILAFTVSSSIVALNASWILKVLPMEILNIISSALFIALGVLFLINLARHKESEEIRDYHRNFKYVTILATLIIAELGDKTQLSIFSLVISVGAIPAVLGGILGYSAVNLASSCISAIARRVLKLNIIVIVSSFIFIAIGLAKLLGFSL